MNVEYTLSDCLQIVRRFIDLGEYHMVIGDLLMYLKFVHVSFRGLCEGKLNGCKFLELFHAYVTTGCPMTYSCDILILYVQDS